MPFMKEKMKKKDEADLEDMQEQINEADLSGPVAMEAAKSAEEGVEEASPVEVEAPAMEALSAENEKLTAELAERDDRYLRLQADFDNFRRRTRQEKEELAAVVTQSLLKDMLPLLDKF